MGTLRMVERPCRQQVTKDLVGDVAPIIINIPLHEKEEIYNVFGSRVAMTGTYCMPDVRLDVSLPGYQCILRFTVVDKHQLLLIGRRIATVPQTHIINFCEFSSWKSQKKKR